LTRQSLLCLHGPRLTFLAFMLADWLNEQQPHAIGYL